MLLKLSNFLKSFSECKSIKVFEFNKCNYLLLSNKFITKKVLNLRPYNGQEKIVNNVLNKFNISYDGRIDISRLVIEETVIRDNYVEYTFLKNNKNYFLIIEYSLLENIRLDGSIGFYCNKKDLNDNFFNLFKKTRLDTMKSKKINGDIYDFNNIFNDLKTRNIHLSREECINIISNLVYFNLNLNEIKNIMLNLKNDCHINEDFIEKIYNVCLYINGVGNLDKNKLEEIEIFL